MRLSVTRIPGLVAAVTLCLATTLHAQTPALELGPLTLSSTLPYFSGQTVRLSGVRVDEVLSPRVFIVEPDNMPRTPTYWSADSRALVVLAAPPSTPLQRGASLVIVGQPWSLYETQLKGGPDLLPDLGKKRMRRYQHKPVIQATLVRTPGGVQLYTH